MSYPSLADLKFRRIQADAAVAVQPHRDELFLDRGDFGDWEAVYLGYVVSAVSDGSERGAGGGGILDAKSAIFSSAGGRFFHQKK